MSNPRNPTGEVIAGTELAALVDGMRATGAALLVDEFYSHYVYAPGPDGTFGPAARPVSAAEHVDDVDADPVLIFDGLTKNLRYPGWRLGWVVGPADAIGVIERVGQAMDGGTSQVVQRAALAALEPSYLDAETTAGAGRVRGEAQPDGRRPARGRHPRRRRAGRHVLRLGLAGRPAGAVALRATRSSPPRWNTA